MNKALKGLLWAGAGVAGVAIANNAVFARAKALGNTLGGEARFWPGPYGDLFYTRQGQGQPVVLLHGLYAGASSYEWRKNFDSLSEHFSVYFRKWSVNRRTWWHPPSRPPMPFSRHTTLRRQYAV
jgi:pimeloyl-ACP methyl ester carboxylesterase